MSYSQRRAALPAMMIAFAVAASSMCSHDAKAHVPLNNITSFRLDEEQNVINYVMNEFEKSDYVEDDNGHGPARFGIVGSSNGLSPEEVRNLTPRDAVQIYKSHYWDAINANDLPPEMRLVAFNAAVQFGVGQARTMIAEAHGNPSTLLDEEADLYSRIVRNNPDLYGPSMRGWMRRHNTLVAYVGRSEREEFKAFYSQAKPFHDPLGPSVADEPVSGPTLVADIQAAAPPHDEAGGVSDISSTSDKIDGLTPDLSFNKSWPIWLAFVGATFAIRSRKRPSKGHIGAYMPSSSLTEDMTADEWTAFYQIFWERHPTSLDTKNSWKVDYVDGSQVTVQHGSVSLKGNAGVEDALKYAAAAWGNKCVLSGASAEFKEQARATAQKLVDDGVIASGFTIDGLGVFTQTAHRPKKSRSYAKRSTIFSPAGAFA